MFIVVAVYQLYFRLFKMVKMSFVTAQTFNFNSSVLNDYLKNISRPPGQIFLPIMSHQIKTLVTTALVHLIQLSFSFWMQTKCLKLESPHVFLVATCSENLTTDGSFWFIQRNMQLIKCLALKCVVPICIGDYWDQFQICAEEEIDVPKSHSEWEIKHAVLAVGGLGVRGGVSLVPVAVSHFCSFSSTLPFNFSSV